jgi:hypothetical protein
VVADMRRDNKAGQGGTRRDKVLRHSRGGTTLSPLGKGCLSRCPVPPSSKAGQGRDSPPGSLVPASTP